MPRTWTVLRTALNARTPLACLGQSNKVTVLPLELQPTSGNLVFQGGNYQVLSCRIRPNLLNGHGFSCHLATAHMWMGTHQGLCRRAPG
ncbi:hypothetical protein U0070_013141 [Myodes glareolus]|uniref:Uncharacterized protein n=1 Tax=Myodes glareolus TaxID=447135 RepID=A0AAW0HJ94_MYOGA